MRPYYEFLPDVFILVPTCVISVGRCACSGEVAGFSISLSWANLEAGLEISL